MKNLVKSLILTAVATTAWAGGSSKTEYTGDAAIAVKLAKEIRMYSRYTIWDHVKFRVRDGSVELIGQVSQPFKKNDLGRIAQRVPGVVSVTNTLEVLPLSPFDNELRIRVARAIFRDPALNRYAFRPVPPIHIIVNRGQVTLEGVVLNELEKTIAFHRASGAGLSFGPVINNLRVENAKPKG